MRAVCLLLFLNAASSGFVSFTKKESVFNAQGETARPVLPVMVYAIEADGILQDGFVNSNQGAIDKNSLPVNYQYTVRCKQEVSFGTPWVKQEHVTRRISYTTCSELLNSRELSVKVSRQATETVKVPLIPVPRVQTVDGISYETRLPGIVRGQIGTCCNPSSCPEKCLELKEAVKCELMIVLPTRIDDSTTDTAEWNKFLSGQWKEFGKGNSYVKLQAIMSIPCDYCPLVNCIRNCTNGQFATSFSDYNEDGVQTKRISCETCPPGTWNTCMEKTDCTWNIPGDRYERQSAMGMDIYPIAGGPVISCYGCDQVSNFKYHFIGTSKQVYVNASSWKCPGGKSAPQNCPSTAFERSANGSACVCKPGNYQNPTQADACIPCPAGSMCPDGVLVKCPIHYFQISAGKTFCERCSTTGDANGYFKDCLVRGQQLQYCDPAVANTQNAPLTQLCVSCNQCRRPYTQAAYDPNQRNCYRGR